MQRRIQKWKRFLAIFLMGAMLLTNDYGLTSVFAEETGSNTGNTRAGEEEVKTNIDLNAKLVINENASTILTGQEFQYEFTYTIPDLGANGGEYSGAKLIFTLPDYVYVPKDSKGNYKISGGDYESTSYNSTMKEYEVTFKDPLTKSQANTLVIVLKTDNVVTPDDIILNFGKNDVNTPANPNEKFAKFTFQTQFLDASGVNNKMTQQVYAGKVTTEASAKWQIVKKNVTNDDKKNYVREGDKFKVTYQIEVSDDKGTDRFGRLGFTEYKVTDTLPTSLPEGGEAIQITNVSMVRQSGNKALELGKDYTITKNGDHPVSITFNTYDTIETDNQVSQYLAKGDVTNTLYEYTVVYPYKPYTTLADQNKIKEHELVNTAELEYTLVGGTKGTDTDNAVVNIGAYEEGVIRADLSVKKMLKVGNENPFVMTDDVAKDYGLSNAVEFTLYTNQECTSVAYNTERVLMSEISPNEDGIATFPLIRTGTYYIEESKVPAGWTAPAVIKAVVDASGNVSYYALNGNEIQKSGSTNTVEVINTAATINAVEFIKQGLDAYGNAAENLQGATFTLTNQANPNISFTDTSDKNGKVRFDNVPDGTYDLVETAVSEALEGKGYEARGEEGKVSFEVTGGAVVKPTLDGNNIFMNESAKGRLTIVKVDAKEISNKLPGAVFRVYGPYTDEQSAEAAKEDPQEEYVTLTTGEEGTITSGPLKEGYYVVKETEAPANYTAGAAKVVLVQARATTPASVTIQNDPQARVYFSKKGAEQAGSSLVLELAGAKFEIYDANGDQLYGVKDANGNFNDISTDDTGREAVIIVTKKDATNKSISNYVTLSPGFYKYKEIEVPAPFTAENTLTTFEVESVAPETEGGNWQIDQTKTIYNYLTKGQIRIQKETDDDKTDANSLNGAVFRVYENEEDALANRNWKDEITTATVYENIDTDEELEEIHGVGYSDAELALDKTYYVKEVTAPAGYAVDTVAHPVSFNEDDKVAELEITNKRTVSIQITKIDSQKTDVKLAGAKFALYESMDAAKSATEAKPGTPIGGKNGVKTTDKDGIVTFDNLKPNTTYYCKEIKAPDNYLVQDGGVKTITTGSTDNNPITFVPVQNDREATFKLYKTTTGGVAFSGVTFRLAPVQNTAAGLLADTSNLTTGTTAETNASGYASFEELVPGTYWLIETVPTGYETGSADDTIVTGDWKVVKYGEQEYFYKQVTVAAGQNIEGYTSYTENVTNTPTKGRITVKKWAANADGSVSDTVISGVRFDVYSDEKLETKVDEIVTLSDGSATSKYLAPGTYYMKEIAAPGYIVSDTVYKVVVKAGSITNEAKVQNIPVSLLAIVNKKQGSFIVDKMAAYNVVGSQTNEVTREPLVGAKFALYKFNAGLPTDIVETAKVATLDLENRSSGSFGPLNPGIYWLVEETAPNGYDKAANSLVQIYSDGSVKFATWTNGADVDSLDWKAQPENTVIVDNFSKNPRIRLIKIENDKPTVLLDGAKFEVYVADDATGIETDVDGIKVNLSPVYTKNGAHLILESGTVRVGDEQIHGHALTPNLEAGHVYYFKEIQAPTNPSGYHYDPSDIWQSIDIPANATGEYQVIFENYPDVTAPGIKYGPDGETKLSGAVLAIFDNEDHAMAMRNTLKGNYDEFTNPLTKAIVEANQTAWNIDMIVESDAKGEFNFINLIPGKTYYIVEVVAPNGYQLDRDSNGDYCYYKVVVAATIGNGDTFSSVYKGTNLLENVHTLAINNYEKQQIWLDKKVKLSGAEYWIGGAEFTIYPSTADGNPDTAYAITPSTLGPSSDNLPGRFLSGLLPAGTYWLKETKVPNGYTAEADRNVVNTAFGSNTQDSVVINGERYYKVVLGREADNTWFKEHPVYNVAQNGKFVLTKINSVTKAKIQATFSIEVQTDDGFKPYETYPSITTSENGYVLSNYLPAGLYRLTETGLKDAYKDKYTMSAEPIYVKIEAGKITDGTETGTEIIDGKTVTVYTPVANVEHTQSDTNDPVLTNSITVSNVPKGKFYIHKTGKWNNEPEDLQYVTFAVYNKTANSFEAEPANKTVVTTMTTNNSGIADSGLLDAGEYWVIETGITGNKADEYKKDSYTAASVTVVAGQTERVDLNTLKVINISNFGKFKVTKVDSLNPNTTIKGVTFKIYNNKDCTGSDCGTMTDNGDGTYTSPRLAPGNYYIKETNVPNEYTINKDKISGPYTVTANNLNVVENKITNEHDKSLTVIKYEQKGTQKTDTTLSGAKFALYTSFDAAQAATENNPGTPIGSDRDDKGVKITNADGKATWDDLKDGTYYLKELKAPENYLLKDVEEGNDPNIYTVNITGKGVNNTYEHQYKVYNLLKGGFELKKVINWQGVGNESLQVAGKNITFDLYEGTTVDSNSTLITTLTTNAEGKIAYRLPAGDYVLVEKFGSLSNLTDNAYDKPDAVPDDGKGNSIDENGYIHIHVNTSEINKVFSNNAVVNEANYGKFYLTKKTYADNDKNTSQNLSGAQYLLERKVVSDETNEDTWEIVKNAEDVASDGTFTITSANGYESGPLEPGDYRVTEIKAPTPISNGTQNVYFIVDSEPIEFTVVKAQTVQKVQYDTIYRNLKVIKKADDDNNQVTLEGIKFELYAAKSDANTGKIAGYNNKALLAENGQEVVKELLDGYKASGSETPLIEKITTDKNGVALFMGIEYTAPDGKTKFKGLLPGKYLLVETEVPAGYEKQAVVIEIAASKSWLDVAHEFILNNSSEMGRILIKKQDMQGNAITKDTANNAVFKIYAKTDSGLKNELDTVYVDETGVGKSVLLPEGEYYVVEVKAPSGYTLDDRLLPVKKLVTISGNQNPTVDFTGVAADAKEGYTDKVIFQNRTYESTGAVNASIGKYVRIKGATNFEEPSVASDKSLMFQDVTVEFLIRVTHNLEKGGNRLPLYLFEVTDETLTFLDREEQTIAKLADPDSSDYVMNSITIGKAKNEDANKPVSATVYVKTGTTSATWTKHEEIADLSAITEPVKVVLPANTVGFKVAYENAQEGFNAEALDDIIVEVTFKQRPSDATIEEVRKITNTASLYWEDTSKDQNGDDEHKFGTVSADASVTFPVYDTDLPILSLKNDKVNVPASEMYYSGGTIDFKTVGTVLDASKADLKHPVMSINLPPYTTLDTNKYPEGGGSGIRATADNGTVLNFTYVKVEETVGGKPVEKYILDFGEDSVLAAGKSITLEYTANISLNVPDGTIFLESNGFIGSAYQLPLTVENPTGLSFKQGQSDSSQDMVDDSKFDTGLETLGNDIQGDKLKYLQRPVSINLTRTNALLIRKYVSADKQNWTMTEVPTVKPADLYYYKLSLVNGGDDVRRARIVDILPFTGDSQEFRAASGGTLISRATNLPHGEGYEQVELVAVTPNDSANVVSTIYYYVENEDVTETIANRDWTKTNREKKTSVDELPMLTSHAKAEDVWTGNWTTTAPADMSKVTAIGVEVEFKNGDYLSSGDEYDVILTMRAPGYTAEKMADYENVVIANTTAATVTRSNGKDTDPINVIDRVSSNEVHTKLYITTGSIGDYAFYDNNDNGIQDEGDVPARNIPVTLYRRKSTTTMTEKPKWEKIATTYTDQTTGEYWFEGLPCNYMIPGLDTKAEGFDVTDPANYIGNTYFEYQVEFGIPQGYAATIQEVGEDKAVDSNINQFGVTKPVALALTVNEEGKLEGEINPTIDAGYVKLVNLGDYVWVDYNKNGVQDESEVGLNGATVRLYKLTSAEDTIEGKEPYKVQITDNNGEHDGYYCFTNLPKGYYVVEFDISTVDKPIGYTTKYSFTVNDAGTDGADSDAAFVKDKNNQIMYTKVIHLTEDDMTWDAGVTVYSALGGFVFDDQDYNDTQSIETEFEDGSKANGIPLVGTVVTLYKVNEDGSMDPEAIGSQTVGEDGRYFFDKLDAGRYKVHFDYPDEYIGVQEGIGDYLHDSETKFFDDSTLNSGFTDIIELPEDTIDLTHDAGAYLLSAIGDYVWEDIDRDGIQDPDEKPVADIVVTLQQKLGEGEWTTIETTTTDENGLYLFDGLKSSDHFDVQYRVAFAIPLTVELTGDNAGEDRAQDSNALPTLDVEYGYFTKEIILPYGQDDMTIDAGLYYRTELCEVGDYVWYDDDRDGIQDANEKGVEGIVVVLERCSNGETWDEEAWEVVGTTKTDANGKYIFTDLQPGYYRVAFGVGDPWVVTISRVGDIALDSDAIRPDGDYYYTSSFYLNAGDSDMTWDAGIYKPSPKGTETGDNANTGAWLSILLVSAFVLVIMLKKRREI